MSFGPALPPDLQPESPDAEETDATENNAPLPLGPALPPGFVPGDGESDSESGSECGEVGSSRILGPSLPPDLLQRENLKEVGFGPSLPPDLKQNESEQLDFGPSLPPDLAQDACSSYSDDSEKESAAGIGPKIPRHVLKNKRETEPDDSITDHFGPALPPDLTDVADIKEGSEGHDSPNKEDEEDEVDVGPQLPMDLNSADEPDETYEQRLERFRYQKFLEENASKKNREEWMTELPTKLSGYGLGARTFSKRGVADSQADRSDWTDSPADRMRKALTAPGSGASGSSAGTVAPSARDTDLQRKSDKMNKDRTESLLDKHQNKRKAEDEESGASKVRRPFDRDKDMNYMKLSAGGVKGLKDRVGALGSKFGHSSSQKFL